MSLFRKFLLILPVSLVFALTGWAQTASFEGTVKGTDGKPLPGAQVKIERQDVKGNYNVKTDKKGHYFYGGLPLGNYKITVAADGQDRDSRNGVRTKVGETTDISFDLELLGLRPPPPPRLLLKPSGNTALLEWSAFAQGFGLQSSADLGSTGWAWATNAIAVTNARNSITIGLTNSGGFYRLKKRNYSGRK